MSGDPSEPRTSFETGAAVAASGDPAADRQPAARVVWARLIVFALLMAAGVVLGVVVGLPDAEQLRAEIAGIGPTAPVLFGLFYAVATLAPLPKNVFAALAGLLFGLVEGVVVVLLAALLGASAAFWLGKLLGREAVERSTLKRRRRAQRG